jgi:hypothetical protein
MQGLAVQTEQRQTAGTAPRLELAVAGILIRSGTIEAIMAAVEGLIRKAFRAAGRVGRKCDRYCQQEEKKNSGHGSGLLMVSF